MQQHNPSNSMPDFLIPEQCALLDQGIRTAGFFSGQPVLLIAGPKASNDALFVAQELSFYYSRQKDETLVVQLDDSADAGETPSTRGLTHLKAQLKGRPLESGRVADFGLCDLFFLFNLQKKTGILSLAVEGQKGVWQAIFREGLLCSLATPEQDLSCHLPFFVGTLRESYTTWLLQAKKQKQPLIDLLVAKKVMGVSELAFGYRESLLNMFEVFKKQNFGSFSFLSVRRMGWQKVPELLNQEFVLSRENLADQHFISRCVQLNVQKLGVRNHLLCHGKGKLDLKNGAVVDELSRLFCVLERFYDRILVVGSFFGRSKGALNLARLSQGAVLVVEAGQQEKRRLVHRASRASAMAQVPFLGVVLVGGDSLRQQQIS